ncbi:hypothetical protein AB0C84_25530 [Actinomadura sp. NPDC048955]|uniref:hypothetical protein n=1 Tax=Actinomadura sp. NPDC048955 TaxID=3158228 RepID=UPI0033D1FB74
MTKFMIVRSAVFIRGAVIGAVLVIAAAIITGVCAAVMSNGDQHSVLGTSGVVAIAVSAVAGAVILVVVNGIVNVVDGVGFTWPNALLPREIRVAVVLNLAVGAVVGAVCGVAFFDRVLADDLLFNAYAGGWLGLGCACAMGIGGLAAMTWTNR